MRNMTHFVDILHCFACEHCNFPFSQAVSHYQKVQEKHLIGCFKMTGMVLLATMRLSGIRVLIQQLRFCRCVARKFP